MTLTKIYLSKQLKQGEAIVIAPDGELVMSAEDFRFVAEYALKFAHGTRQITKAPKTNEQTIRKQSPSNWGQA